MAFNESTNRNKARTWTIAIHVLLLLWFAFTGLKYQDPPPEEGIAINFGYEESGNGDNSQAAACLIKEVNTLSEKLTVFIKLLLKGFKIDKLLVKCYLREVWQKCHV